MKPRIIKIIFPFEKIFVSLVFAFRRQINGKLFVGNPWGQLNN